MEIVKWGGDRPGQTVKVSRTEAIRIIGSLAVQIGEEMSDRSLGEFYTVGGEYFYISVHPEAKKES